MRYRFAMRLIIVFVVACGLVAVGCSKQNAMSGKWQGKITLPATGKSLTDLEFSLTQRGSELTGTMVFLKLGAKLPLAGTVKDRKVSLSSPMKNGLAVSITGTLERRDKVKGEAVLTYDTAQLGKREDRTVLELTR
jgi:hypothetical protein